MTGTRREISISKQTLNEPNRLRREPTRIANKRFLARKFKLVCFARNVVKSDFYVIFKHSYCLKITQNVAFEF